MKTIRKDDFLWTMLENVEIMILEIMGMWKNMLENML